MRDDHPNETAALQAVADKLGIGSRENFRNLTKQQEIDAGQRLRTMTEESAQLKALKKESAGPRQLGRHRYGREHFHGLSDRPHFVLGPPVTPAHPDRCQEQTLPSLWSHEADVPADGLKGKQGKRGEERW
ncbi:hypothetical protein ACH4MW_04085 [Streptomyces luteogriseus]|uniref:hypothetical protein n=1 Tax=Streptomyces luteogriseus TaxID=68233 RepID=UPI0037A954AD